MQNMTPNNVQNQTGFTPPGNAASDQEHPFHAAANPAQPGNQPPFFYTQGQEDDPHLPPPQIDEQDDLANQSSPFILPFQPSAGMPTLGQMPAQGSQGSIGTPPGAPPPTNMPRKSLRTIRILLVVGVVLTALIGASLFVFAQSVPLPRSASPNKTQTRRTAGTPTALTTKPTQRAAAKTKPTPSGSRPKAAANAASNPQPGTPATEISPAAGVPSAQVLSQLGWTQAGLSLGDAIEALRTGTTFTDREMSYDYRNIGTPAAHGGTLTGSIFLLTPGGLVRFAHNDVRVINNVLYDKIRTGKIIQQVMNTQPSLVHFQIVPIQGQPRQFAWVNVAFELFQSKIDPASGKRAESLERDPTTGQPMIHHMVVVLVRVPPQEQGVNAPMGGTGWLVDTYALDANTLPAIATDPSL